MLNLRSLAKKLQIALCERGEYYKINQIQSYSPKTNRMITKYCVVKIEKVDGKIKKETILETFKLPEVVKTLAEIYGGG